MKSLRLVLVGLALVLLTAGTAPIKPAGTLLSPALTEQYLGEAVKYSRYSTPWLSRPVIHVLPNEDFDEKFCGKPECGIVGATSGDYPYEIYLREDLPPGQNPIVAQSKARVIVHELIHWLQGIHGASGSPSSCADRTAMEVEAYAGAYLYAIKTEKLSQPFWMADPYNTCMMMKMMRGHH